jgi:hypothetical protein
MASAKKQFDDRVKELQKGGAGRSRAEQQARKETLAGQDAQWREQGQRESGGSKKGWGL